MTSTGHAADSTASIAVDGSALTIAEVAELTGLSKDTLRYYEKAGLVAAVDRSSGGQRRYAAADLAWLQFLLRLRATGMSIADMRLFAELRRGGEATVGQRLEMLERHHRDVHAHIDQLRSHLAALDAKITHYRHQLAAKENSEGQHL
ncbi:MerR family transcriptional regulator [Mycobacterium sp. smrl_JER01]|uniref:MerR family transcriptional regulator n=1 Tax=Mycobacterium sp. smrl_JER01 TaxID=3402633 RepID=UPI003AC9E986